MALDYKVRLAGSNNPVWRGGRYGYKGTNWDSISKTIIQRDKVCQDCGQDKRLVAHHLIPQRFWINLDDANQEDNLIALCVKCHPKRPEHYWNILPDNVYDKNYHCHTSIKRRKNINKPKCLVCGNDCKRKNGKYCSYTCSNKAKWQDGIYQGLEKNFIK